MDEGFGDGSYAGVRDQSAQLFLNVSHVSPLFLVYAVMPS